MKLRNVLLCVLVSSTAFMLSAKCHAQVGYGAVQTPVTTGGFFSALPVTTRGNTHVRMGVSAGFSQIIDVHTFSPVQNWPGLMPVGPIGFTGGFNGGMMPPGGMNPGFNANAGNNQQVAQANQRPTPNQFVSVAGKFDHDRNRKLDQTELAEVGRAVIAELQRMPKVSARAFAGKAGGPASTKPEAPTTEEMTEAFVKRCMKFDDDGDESLNESETLRMAAALIRSLG